MTLHLIAAQSQRTYTVDWLDVTCNQGNMVIQSGHAPIILSLIANSDLIFYLSSGQEKKIYITRPAFLEVKRNEATILFNQEI